MHYPEIHGLSYDLLVNDQWSDKILNPSRCLLLSVDQWATVSNTYKDDILENSALRDLLERFPSPFAQSNGINSSAIRTEISRQFGELSIDSHLKAKAYLQRKYFGMDSLDDSKILFSTIGRMVEQKQVMLVLNIVAYCVKASKGTIQFMIAGNINPGDQYGLACALKCRELQSRFPQNFWAAPDLYFNSDRPALLHGSDFGLLCSKFEPGGLVQLEYLAADTPVLAAHTGGLKDTLQDICDDCSRVTGVPGKPTRTERTVICATREPSKVSPNLEELSGTGYFIDQCSELGVVKSMQKAATLYENRPAYHKVRDQCCQWAVDVRLVSEKYLQEFYRVMRKVRVKS